VTTREPGARLVFTHGFEVRPRSPRLAGQQPRTTSPRGWRCGAVVRRRSARRRPELGRRPSRVRGAHPRGLRVARVRSRRPGARWPSYTALAIFRGTRPAGRRGPARLRLTFARSSSSSSGVACGPRTLVAPQALSPGVRADQFQALARPAGQLEVAHRFRVDREDAAGAAVLGRHVGDGRRSASGRLARPSPKKLANLSTTPSSQHLGHGQHRSVAVARVAGRLETKADHCGISMVTAGPAWRFSLDPTPQPSTPRPLIIGGVGIGADECVREARRMPPASCRRSPFPSIGFTGERCRIGRTTEKLRNAVCPAQERVALRLRDNRMAVLAASAPGVPYSSTCTEWSITAPPGSAVDAFGVAPQAHDRIAHGR